MRKQPPCTRKPGGEPCSLSNSHPCSSARLAPRSVATDGLAVSRRAGQPEDAHRAPRSSYSLQQGKHKFTLLLAPLALASTPPLALTVQGLYGEPIPVQVDLSSSCAQHLVQQIAGLKDKMEAVSSKLRAIQEDASALNAQACVPRASKPCNSSRQPCKLSKPTALC